MSRRSRDRFASALLTSAALHAGAVVLLWITASATPLPPMRVYAVDIVSPPPRQAGPPSPEPVAPPQETPQPAPAPSEPEPAPEPAPEPSPPAPTTKKPEPAKPEPKKEAKPAPAKPKPQEPAPEAAKPKPSTGKNPDPESAGGEDLTVKFDGLRCIVPEYCENIIRQINRYFRNPPGVSGSADLYFVIGPDGSVSDIRVISNTGGLAFRLAVMEAVEQAGLNRAFGSLPGAFGDQLPVRFTFEPVR